MAKITTEMIKQLREMTGAGIKDVKEALVEAEGDFDKAIEILRKKGIAKSEKKLSRTAKQGLVGHYLSDDRKFGALVELNCETDFVAATDDFKNLLSEILDMVVKNKPASVEELLSLRTDSGDTVEEKIKLAIGKIGENIVLRRFAIFETKDGLIEIYVHPGSMLAAMVEVRPDDEAVIPVARDIAMQIAAMAPYSVSEKDFPQDVLEREKKIYREQALEQGKPENIVERIVEGKIRAFLEEKTLLAQPFIKDTGKTVGEYLKEKSTELGKSIEVVRFVRFKVGEE